MVTKESWLVRSAATSPCPVSSALTVVVMFMGGAPILASASGSKVNPKDTEASKAPVASRPEVAVN